MCLFIDLKDSSAIISIIIVFFLSAQDAVFDEPLAVRKVFTHEIFVVL